MIVCKPKAGSLFSLGIFSIGGISVGGFSLNLILTQANPPWFHYLSALTLFPLSVIIFARIFWSYKVIEFGKERVSVRFIFRFKSFAMSLKEIGSWKETRVNTKTGGYREIEIKSGSRKITLNLQEHTNYLEALKYLEKKAAKNKQR